VLVPDFNHFPSAYSSDYRLSELNTFSLGLRATYRIQKHLSLDAGYMRYVMRGLDDMTSQTAFPSANIFTLGLRGWF
jgi:long-subunit fatty acid transport protein